MQSHIKNYLNFRLFVFSITKNRVKKTMKRPNPDDHVPTEAQIQWRMQDPDQKRYEQGTETSETQQEIRLNFHVRGNLDLPLPPSDYAQSPFIQRCQPKASETDPNRVYGGALNRFYYHSSKTIASQYKAGARKIAEKQWLAANGNPETTIIKDPSKRLMRLLDQKLHPENIKKRPQLPKNYKERANKRYPSVSEPFSYLLYLHNDLRWPIDDIAYCLNSSPRQIEEHYETARLQHLVTSTPCPPSISFKKTKAQSSSLRQKLSAPPISSL
jgi:hypothetical protein